MKTRSFAVFVVVVVVAGFVGFLTAFPAVAQGGGISAAEGFRLFHESFAPAAFLPPRHAAEPLGWVGLEVWADASLASGFEDIDRPAEPLASEIPTDGLAIGRIGVRKGLPGKFNLGVSYGEIFDAGFDLAQADLSWSWLKGSTVTPAVAFRVSVAQSVGGNDFDFEQYAVDLSVSKGFANLTPYAGVALVRSESRLDRPAASGNPPFVEKSTDAVFFAGVRISLLLPKFTLAVEQGEEFQGVLRVSLGF
jgi:hypothetical protein